MKLRYKTVTYYLGRFDGAAGYHMHRTLIVPCRVKQVAGPAKGNLDAYCDSC